MPTSLFSAVNPANADVLAIKLAVDCETPDFMARTRFVTMQLLLLIGGRVVQR